MKLQYKIFAGGMAFFISTCIIIFVTNYDQYVSSAFRIEAFQYLKKPIDDKVFQEEYSAYSLYNQIVIVRNHSLLILF